MTLSCSTDGAVIRYTADGSDPAEESPVYTAPIFISETVTVKAAAFKAGMLPSDVLTVSYTVPEETVIIVPEKVVATMNGKTVSDGDTLTPGYLTLTTATEGAEIWYTTNGVCPRFDPAPINYTGPIYLEPGTYYFRIRALLNGEWSEGLPLHLTVTEGDAKIFTVTFETNGGSAVAAQKVREGEKAVKPADPIKDGCTFNGWYSDAELTAEYGFDAPVTADITVYAKWTKNSEPAAKHKITFDLNGGTLDGKTGTVTVEAEAGSTIILPKPEKEGYTFEYWEGSEYKAGESYTVTGDHTFTAQWKKNTADGTVNPNTGSKVLWSAAAAVSVIGILCILLSGKKRRSGKISAKHLSFRGKIPR